MTGPVRQLLISCGLCSLLLPACRHAAAPLTSDACQPLDPALLQAERPYSRSPGSENGRSEAGEPRALSNLEPELLPQPDAIEEISSPEASVSAKEHSQLTVPIDSPIDPPPTPSPKIDAPRVPDGTPKRTAVVLALQAFIENRPDEAIEYLKAYDPKDQELLIRLLPILAQAEKTGLAFSRFTDSDKLNLLEILRACVAVLEPSAPLEIKKIFFCAGRAPFGKAQPLNTSTFRPGDEIRIHAELENLVDLRSDEDRYVINLASSVEIHRADNGQRVCEKLPETSPDYSQSPRRDHSRFIRFYLPADLPPGFYTLHVRVTDRNTGRVSKDKTLDFRVETIKVNADSRRR